MIIKITIDDLKADKVLNAFCAIWGYQETITNEIGETINNPQTKEQFVKRYFIRMLKDSVKRHEEDVAISNAIKTVGNEELNIT
jgi:hypothetical protein